MHTTLLTRFEIMLSRWWWVILFVFLCGILFEQAVKRRNKDYAKLSEHWTKLQVEMSTALQTQQELLKQINSESDPAWVELVLMQKLGVVPEGQTKVFFKK